MSAENLKGCCPHTRRLPLPSKGVVDHSTKIPGGGSRDPIPLEHISAGTTHLSEGIPGEPSGAPQSGHLINHICVNCSYRSPRKCTKKKPFPFLINNPNHISGKECIDWKPL